MKALTYNLALALFRDEVSVHLTHKLSLQTAINLAHAKLTPYLQPRHLDRAEQDVLANPPQPLGA